MLPRTGPTPADTLPGHGIEPLAHPPDPDDRPPALYRGGIEPLAGDRPSGPNADPPEISRPLGDGPPRPVVTPLDPRTTRLVRLDFQLGPVFRVRPTDVMTTLGVAVGPMQGISGTFHTSFIFASQRAFVGVYDVPIGAGAVLRGRLRNRPLYGSVGLTGGILVHRAETLERGVLHRVDPDIRLPLRASWAISDVGLTLSLVPAYSVRSRTYETRGAEVWNRHSVRIALLIGLHWDIVAGRARVVRRPSSAPDDPE